MLHLVFGGHFIFCSLFFGNFLEPQNDPSFYSLWVLIFLRFNNHDKFSIPQVKNNKKIEPQKGPLILLLQSIKFLGFKTCDPPPKNK